MRANSTFLEHDEFFPGHRQLLGIGSDKVLWPHGEMIHTYTLQSGFRVSFAVCTEMTRRSRNKLGYIESGICLPQNNIPQRVLCGILDLGDV